MSATSTLLTLAHLVGLALGVGVATVKTALVVKARAQPEFVAVFLAVRKPVTRFIVGGLILTTLSGIAWLVQGYPWSPRLVLKVSVVAAMWILGPVIDNVAEPQVERLAPAPGAAPTSEFQRAQQRHLAIELVATGLMYVAFVLGATL